MSLDVAVLGYRFMGEAHANALARLPQFFPAAPAVNKSVLIGRDPEAVSDAAERLDFDVAATDWEDVVADVDVFYNLGPNHVHEEPSVAALQAGTHVLCEKPLANTLDGARRMADAAAETDAVAATAFNYRFVPAIQYTKRLLDAGELGEVRHFRARYLQDWLVDPEAPWSWRNSEELAGSGALGDLGAHSVDLARFLVGDVERVSGHLRTFVEERPIESDATDDPPSAGSETRAVTVDDAFTAQAAFENGATGTFEASRVAPGSKNGHTIEIDGSKGSVRFDLERLNELEVKREGSRGFETVLVTDEDDPYVGAWWPPGHVLGWEHTFVHENYEFLRSIDEDEAFSPSFADGLAAQEVLSAIEESDEKGAWVDVA